jgi:hypothetical protein
MDQLRGNLRQRDEDEGALVQARVRQRQLRCAEHHIANQEQIEIERSRSVREGAGAAELALDAEQRAEEGGGIQRGL